MSDRFLSTSQEDLTAASPPYKPEASTSNLDQTLLVHHDVYSYPPSPAYRSQVNMSEDIEPAPRDPKEKPSVHYPEHFQPPTTMYKQNDVSRPLSLAPTLTDDEYDDDNYDWSGEEDLVDEEAKFEKQMGLKQKDKRWTFKRVFTLLFSSLIGSTFLAGVIVAPGILIHYFWYKNNPSEHRLYVKQNVQAWLFWAAANLVISWYLALIVDIIPTIFRFMVMAAWGHVSEHIKTRIELYCSIKNTFKPVLYVASAWASWVIIFGHIFNLYDTQDASQSRAHYTERLYQVVEFLFFFGVVVCAQKMLSHAVAFAFHRTAFKDRVDAITEALPVIEKLRDYKPKPSSHSGFRSGFRTPLFGQVGEKDRFSWGGPLNDDGADGDTEGDGDRTVVGTTSRKGTTMSSKGKQRTQSSWFSRSRNNTDSTNRVQSASPERMHEMGAIGSPVDSRPMTPSGLHRYPPVTGTPSPRHSTDGSDMNAGETIAQAAKALKNAVLHDARNIKGDDSTSGGGLLFTGGVGSVDEAKHLARSIYTRFRPHHVYRTYLLPEDFYPAFSTREQAEKAFRLFDKDNNGDISRGEIKSTLVKVYKERRFLARSMRDVGAALKTLDHILLFFAMVVLFFISLSIFGVNVGDSLTSVYTIGIAASFIFKTSASNAFDAIMFLFVTHPYDTGDRCFIDDEILVVKKMNLFATVFTRVDGTETYYFNNQLFSKFITNVRRSDKMFENLTMQVAWRTPLEALDELEECMNAWLSTEENRWYEPSTSIVLQNIEYQRYMEITIGIAHNGTWQDWGLRCARKTAFHAAVQYYCRQLGIIGYEAPLPIVYGDPHTQTYNPPPSPGVDDVGMGSSTDKLPETVHVQSASPVPERMKPTLGFLPPVATRTGVNIRQRKSKSRKANMRGMGDG
ncbi:Mechanosensitive ion channel-domain-containing protein [Armillaria borealis]|uniref:Mechanosensitive ion channel-domain-containing protein n=1 Tax=Armillaria borealis TaxID=47425 RepID=A0AA39K4Y0_9AGAR|nr:Mechanosensitive ion channel-domain-containing protein [Armillaria borealis]